MRVLLPATIITFDFMLHLPHALHSCHAKFSGDTGAYYCTVCVAPLALSTLCALLTGHHRTGLPFSRAASAWVRRWPASSPVDRVLALLQGLAS